MYFLSYSYIFLHPEQLAGELSSVSAFTSHVDKNLPPPDTISSTL